jgi:hypothetical protein
VTYRTSLLTMSHTFKRNRPLFLLLAAFFVMRGQVFAQEDTSRIETEQRSRELNQLKTGPAPAPEEITDPELGDISIVSRAPRPKQFTFYTGQSINFTSNAFLVRDDEQQAVFWNGRAGASYVPYATRNFTPRLTFEQNWFRYDHFSKLDFDSQSLTLDLKYDLNRNDTWFVDGSYTASRLYSQHPSIGEFYRYGLGNLSLTHFAPIGNTPLYLGVTGGGYWRLGDPSLSDRTAAYLNVVALYALRETIQLSAFTRPEFQHYTHDLSGTSREDFNLTVGASVTWNPREYLSVGATAAYIGNFSNVSERRYDVVTPNLFFGAQFAF